MEKNFLPETRQMKTTMRTKTKVIDRKPWFYLLAGLTAGIGLLSLLSTTAFSVQMTRKYYNSDYKPKLEADLAACENKGDDYIASGTPITIEFFDERGADGRLVSIPETRWSCKKSPAAERRAEENRRASESEDFRIARDPSTECDRAVLYEEHEGEKCRKAESAIKSAVNRDQIMQGVSQLGAAAVQANTAVQAPKIDSQDAAFDLQETNIKAGILAAGLETANALYSSVQLSRAESDALAAANGIRSGQAEYVDAENAANIGSGDYVNRLSRAGSLKQIEAQIKADYDVRIAKARSQEQQQRNLEAQNEQRNIAAPGSVSAAEIAAVSDAASEYAAEAARLEEDKQTELARAHEKFKAGIAGSGIEETVKSNFGTFDNFRANASKGIRESEAVAEQAAAAGEAAKLRAISGGLALATQVGQLKALQRLRRDLGDIEPPPGPTPFIPLAGAGRVPTIPNVPGGSTGGDVGDSDFAEFDPLGGGGPRGEVRGGVRSPGRQFGGNGYKPRQVSVSGAGGGGGLGGGSANGASRDPGKAPRSGPSSIQYSGGGAALAQGGGAGGAAGAGGDTDVQDALRSLLGGENPAGDEGAQFEYFRKVASSEQAVSDNEDTGGDPRTIFERVKSKINDAVVQGFI